MKSKASSCDTAFMFIRRFVQLLLGLSLYGFASALMVRGDLGLSPWNIFHQGVAKLTHLSFGTVVGLTGAVILLIWIPLRQRIGVGTIANVLVIGSAADISLAWLPRVAGLPMHCAFLVGGIVLTAVASGIYIGAGLEPGPRDGLMTGIVKRFGWSIRAARTGIEIVVLAVGMSLGGKIGVGTLAYALSIGPLAQIFIRIFTIRSAPPQSSLDASQATARG
jgi:uncharacterized membrane protein YczE